MFVLYRKCCFAHLFYPCKGFDSRVLDFFHGKNFIHRMVNLVELVIFSADMLNF